MNIVSINILLNVGDVRRAVSKFDPLSVKFAHQISWQCQIDLHFHF